MKIKFSKKIFLFLSFILSGSSIIFISCGGSSSSDISINNQENNISKSEYIKQLENQNGIDYQNIYNKTAYIVPQCYTQTIDENNQIHNPCYACHTVGKEPNYVVDTDLQLNYDFPEIALNNPFSNFFRKDINEKLQSISDEDIINYVRQSNYIDKNGNIILKQNLPKDWKGYIPDCYFNFDDEGFDINPKTGEYTGWRAFRYYPFLGTFWPTNGSTDDVLIRLPEAFQKDENGKFNKEIYKINLAIVEALIKQKDIITEPLDEKLAGIDLDKDGKISIATSVKYTWDKDKNSMSYVGLAKKLLQEGKIHLAGGLYPEGTEFLHTVRYIDWDENKNSIKLAPRMKEVRYMKKIYWMTYSDLKYIVDKELDERNPSKSVSSFPSVDVFGGNYEEGLDNGVGWILSGYIEDKKGNLRPQTNEETLYCMGCHSGIGATTDSTFAFARKFEASDKEDILYGWLHWSQRDLKGIPDHKVRYQKYGDVYEYEFYLRNNKSGNEFRTNDEVINKFFNKDGSIKDDMVNKLHTDISILLYPSKERAIMLNKLYKLIVNEQGFIKGREAIGDLERYVHKVLNPNQETGIKEPVY
ncbi:hypothetical protein JCM14244_01660 [Venenivibrio stagnispumantis]|nr:hypothetical protein [Venenivibrio stagnispumantis]